MGDEQPDPGRFGSPGVGGAQSDERTGEWLWAYLETMLARDEVGAFLANLEESFTTDVPELAADAELQRDLRSAIRGQLVAFLDAGFAPAAGSARASISEESHALARTVAQRGLELRVLSQLYHSGHRAMLAFAGELLDREDLDPAFKLRVLTTLWSQTGELLNAMLDELTVTYSQEREQLLQGAFASRVTTVREILDGGGDEATASRVLGYPLHLSHTAVVAWIDDPAVFSGSLDGVLSHLADGRRTLAVPSGARGSWAWIAHGADGDTPVLDPDAVPTGVRVAVGVPASGIDGFRRSHREARAAQAVAEARQKPGTSLTRYADVEVVSLLSADTAAMRALVERRLGGLLGDDPASARLRDTLRTVLACQGNHEAAARRLGVHKNTVRYRMQRVEEILGANFLAHRLEVEVALECFAVFGS